MSDPLVTRDLLDEADASLLDLVDNVLTKGVVIDGEIILGLAGVDLIYLRLGVILCAADRIFPPTLEEKKTRRSRHHTGGGLLGRR